MQLCVKDAIQLCTSIRASAREATTNRADCRWALAAAHAAAALPAWQPGKPCVPARTARAGAASLNALGARAGCVLPACVCRNSAQTMPCARAGRWRALWAKSCSSSRRWRTSPAAASCGTGQRSLVSRGRRHPARLLPLAQCCKVLHLQQPCWAPVHPAGAAGSGALRAAAVRGLAAAPGAAALRPQPSCLGARPGCR